MSFEFVDPNPSDPDPLRTELAMLAQAAVGQPLAQLWQMPVSLVAPRSYLRFSALTSVRAEFAQRGCPVFLRMSGGGLVPQGPGILNLSLAYRVGSALADLSDAIYAHLCDVLQQALGELGVTTHRRAVDGAFCDGRFNLVCHGTRNTASVARKIAGTAQYWRRIPGTTNQHVVLAHAVLLVSADPVEIHARANAFEANLGSGRHYDAATSVSVQQVLNEIRENAPDPGPDPVLDERVRAALHAAVLRHPPPCQESANQENAPAPASPTDFPAPPRSRLPRPARRT